MRLRTRLLTGAVVVGALVVPLGAGAPAGAEPTPRTTSDIDAAVAWLETQQQADGGFEVAASPGFETPDAIFALASAGQADTTWSTAEALAAVEAVTTDGETPKDPLDSVDDWVDSVQGGTGSAATKAQQAAKVIVLVTAPLGLDETDFDPSGDSEEPVDLLAILETGAGTGDYADLPFSGRVYAAWALTAVGSEIPAALLTAIADAQQANGGFNFEGDPMLTGFDPDITASVLIALRDHVPASGSDTLLADALEGMAEEQRWYGEWAGEYDDGNANSTAMAMLAAAGFGSDPDEACWLTQYETRRIGVPYPSPSAAILRRQQDDGHMSSPFDDYGVNTFATSQAIQGLAAAEGIAFYQRSSACTQPATSEARRVVNALYVDLLQRYAETAGGDYWTDQIEGGMSSALLAKRFVGTAEYSTSVVATLTDAYLGRSPTSADIDELGALVRAGRRFDAAARILGGDEFVGDMTAPEWADAVYTETVGRAASAGDEEYVVDQLEAGLTHSQIARRLLGSAEGRSFAVSGIYHDLLRREPGAADLTYWVGELARGVSPERLVTLIIGSAEYRQLAASA